MKKFFVILFVLAAGYGYGQFTYRLDTSVAVGQSGAVLATPWIGGLNSAEYNTMDLNNDGAADLVLFDRMAQKLFTFLNVDNAYEYAPSYEAFFPAEISNWLLLRDFNLDGRVDIFTGNILGIRVFRNITTGNVPEWEPVYFYVGNNKSEVLLTKGLSGMVNVQMQFDDLPSISDLDGDGDLDILSIDYGGSGTVNYNRNFGFEKFGTPDSLNFELVTKAWGKFQECTCGVFAFNGEPCDAEGRTKHAGGKSILALDVNSDLSPDLLMSEAECVYVSLLQNEGSLEAPSIQQSAFYPPEPASFVQYPTSYLEDVDFDGLKDLIVTPGIFSKEDPATDLRSSNWFYKNTGTNTAPNFVFQKKNFLQQEMIDLGDNAVPAFGDFDGDQDLDLFVSNNEYPARITFLENVGTRTTPHFTIQEADFLSLTSFKYKNMRIQFNDLNRDGRQDLVFTAVPDGANTPGVFVLYNKKKSGMEFNTSEIENIPFQISGLENLLFTDQNNDGSVDILKGKSNGAIELWINTGNLSFTLTDDAYLGLGSNPLFTNASLAAGDLNVDGKMDLIIATANGRLQIYSDYKNFDATESPLVNVVYNTVTEQYGSQNLGGRLWATSGNIFGAPAPAIVVGTTLGGLRLLKSEQTGTENSFYSIFPNPVRTEIGEQLTILTSENSTLEIYSITGALLYGGVNLNANEPNIFDPKVFARGLYIFKINSGGKSKALRIVVH